MSPTPQTQEPVSSADLEALAEQLGRVPRGVVAIAARCVCGRPTVVRTAPRLDDGTPFPTSYYLTHPAAVKGCSRCIRSAADAIMRMSNTYFR